MNGFAQATAQVPIPMQAAMASISQQNGVLQSTPAHLDTAKAAAINGATRATISRDIIAAQFHAILERQDPDLALAYKQKRMTSQQDERLRQIAQALLPKLRAADMARREQMDTSSQRPPSANSSSPAPPIGNNSVNGSLRPVIRVATPQQTTNGISSPASAGVQTAPTSAVQAANVPGPPTPVAGVKRKTPPPSGQTQPDHAPSALAGQEHMRTGSFPRPADSEVSANDAASQPYDPGPQPWPNPVGSRPTLTGGLGGAPVMLSTPSHFLFPQVDPEALEAALLPRRSATAGANPVAEAARKESTAALSGLGTKKTIREIVSTIDPRVRVDPDVEDFMLELADEFIDSAIHFACKIAQHRGSETLDVRDLQLHLESNLNLRIPGFSSDETRVSISQSAMVGDVLLGAVGANKPRPGGAASTGSGPGASKAKGKASKEKGSSKESGPAEKDKDAALGRGLRAARMAAVRTARKGS